jgi:hypothetical protein
MSRAKELERERVYLAHQDEYIAELQAYKASLAREDRFRKIFSLAAVAVTATLIFAIVLHEPNGDKNSSDSFSSNSQLSKW